MVLVGVRGLVGSGRIGLLVSVSRGDNRGLEGEVDVDAGAREVHLKTGADSRQWNGGEMWGGGRITLALAVAGNSSARGRGHKVYKEVDEVDAVDLARQ